MDSSLQKIGNGDSSFSQLASLPAEILDLITRDIFSCDVINLYASGFGVLNCKLMNGGITELNCRFEGNSPSWRFQLARKIRRLKVFRLDCLNNLIKDFGWFAINSLSANLEVLDLNYCGSISLWTRVRQDAMSGTHFSMYSLSSRFPLLRYLRLHGQCKMAGGIVDPPNTNLAYTQACIPDYSTWEDFLKHLPLSLRVLDIQESYHFTQSATILLPRKLASLSLSSNFNSILYLPKTLQSLSLNLDTYQILPAYLEGIPPGLTRFTLFSITFLDDSVFEALPRQLIHLTLPSASKGFSINTILSRFPTLQTLELPSLSAPANSLPSAFSSSLIRLSIGHWPTIKAFFDLMPRTLNWLQLGTTEALDIRFGEFLPPSLQFLYLPENDSLTSSHYSHFPKSLLIIKSKDPIQPVDTQFMSNSSSRSSRSSF